jgi:hypothetical protein
MSNYIALADNMIRPTYIVLTFGVGVKLPNQTNTKTPVVYAIINLKLNRIVKNCEMPAADISDNSSTNGWFVLGKFI